MTCAHYTLYARPARPTCIISLVLCSSLLSVGQLDPSSLAKFSSSLVPMILNSDLTVSICPNSGTLVLYLFKSVVGRSKATVESDRKLTFALSLSIFFKYKLAMTFVAV